MTTKPSRISEPPIEAGTVIVVPFPYSDRHAEKRRPALVVSSASLAGDGLLWVIMITTAKRGTGPHDLVIRDPAAAGLSAPCVVRPTKIACIEPTRILRRAGRLEAATAARALSAVRSFVASARTIRS